MRTEERNHRHRRVTTSPSNCLLGPPIRPSHRSVPDPFLSPGFLAGSPLPPRENFGLRLLRPRHAHAPHRPPTVSPPHSFDYTHSFIRITFDNAHAHHAQLCYFCSNITHCFSTIHSCSHGSPF